MPADARLIVTDLSSLLRADESMPLNRVLTGPEGRGIAAVDNATSGVEIDDGRGVRDAAGPWVPDALYGPHREVVTEFVRPLR